jgi:hypothetical protein
MSIKLSGEAVASYHFGLLSNMPTLEKNLELKNVINNKLYCSCLRGHDIFQCLEITRVVVTRSVNDFILETQR